MRTKRASQQESDNENPTEAEDTFDTLAPLEGISEPWSVDPRTVSSQLTIEFSREDFYINESSATGVAIDHLQKDGWVVLAPGHSKSRWEATYERGIEAAVVVSELTHIYEAQRTIMRERPEKWVVRAFFVIEELLLDALKRYEIPDPQSQDPPTPYQ